jgi:aminopeptidase-like protein
METGTVLYDFIRELYPICRSITGNGTRETLRLIKKHIPLEIHEVPTGKKILDWEIPKEWNINDAYIKNSQGEKIVDFQKLNLHVLNYSIPVHDFIDLNTLKEHLYSIPEHPEWVPYRTSYYEEKWGFCMAHNQFLGLEEDTYEVFIDSELSKGSLTYGELLIPGKLEEEVLLSTHICHPSLCNDNLSGIAVNTFIAKELMQLNNKYSYRFIFIPATIGAIAWLSENEGRLSKIKHGLVTSLLGIDGVFTYKRSRSGNSGIDRIAERVLKQKNTEHRIIDFVPYGYDERQFCSPGFDLPVGNISRVPYGQFPEYHSSADNPDLISEKGLNSSFGIIREIINRIENSRLYVNLVPKGEPQLGKRGLYDSIGGRNDSRQLQMALLWVLNFSDGQHSVSDIVLSSGIDISLIEEAIRLLCDKGILMEVN